MPSNAAACWLSRRGSNLGSLAVGVIGFHAVVSGSVIMASREWGLLQSIETNPCPRARGEPYARLRSGRFMTIQRKRRLANHPVYKQLFCESTQSIL